MAIKIRRKVAPEAVEAVKTVRKGGIKKAPPSPPAPEDTQALLDVGLSPEVATEPPEYPYWSLVGSPTKDGPTLSEGDKIIIVNDLYTWMESWQGGDTGIITKVWQPTREASKHFGMGVIEVLLDKPRTKDKVMLHWRDVALV